MPERRAGGEQAVRAIDLRAEFLSQRVQRVAVLDAVCLQPCRQTLEHAVAAVVVVAAHIRFRVAIHANDELGFALLHPETKAVCERRIDVDSGLAALGFRARELVRFDPDRVIGKINLLPGERIDFVATKSGE